MDPASVNDTHHSIDTDQNASNITPLILPTTCRALHRGLPHPDRHEPPPTPQTLSAPHTTAALALGAVAALTTAALAPIELWMTLLTATIGTGLTAACAQRLRRAPLPLTNPNAPQNARFQERLDLRASLRWEPNHPNGAALSWSIDTSQRHSFGIVPDTTHQGPPQLQTPIPLQGHLRLHDGALRTELTRQPDGRTATWLLAPKAAPASQGLSLQFPIALLKTKLAHTLPTLDRAGLTITSDNLQTLCRALAPTLDAMGVHLHSALKHATPHPCANTAHTLPQDMSIIQHTTASQTDARLHIHAPLHLSANQASHGGRWPITITQALPCPHCHGHRHQHTTTTTPCPDCQQAGQRLMDTPTQWRSTGTCSTCNGTGKLIHSPCRHCHGHGRQQQQSTIPIMVPPGSRHGTRLHLPRHGHHGPDGRQGDLFVTIEPTPPQPA